MALRFSDWTDYWLLAKLLLLSISPTAMLLYSLMIDGKTRSESITRRKPALNPTIPVLGPEMKPTVGVCTFAVGSFENYDELY